MATHAAIHQEVGTKIHVGRSALSGLIAGIVFAMVAMVYYAVAGPGLWTPPRMVATILLGPESFQPTFALLPVVLGMMLHMMLSAAYGIVFGVLVSRVTSPGTLTGLGVAFGIGLYLVNFLVIAPVAFQVFAESNQALQIVNHMMFGLVLGGGYALLSRGR